MDTTIYIMISAAYFILFIFAVRSAHRNSWLKMGNLLLPVIIALLYDNGLLALGKWLGEGNLLKVLNEGRYWLHALITPLLIPFAWNTLTRASFSWAKKRISLSVVWILTLAIIIIEIVTVTWNISLEPSWKNGVLSYRDTGSSHGPPIMMISVTMTLLIASILLWWKRHWPWFFVAILLMGLPALGYFFLKSNALHNISELILMVGLFATKVHQDKT